MNILIVTNGFPPTAYGGVEIYSYDLARGLLQKGHQVTVFCRESDFSAPDYHITDEKQERLRVCRVVNDYKKIYSYRDTFVDDKIDEIFEDLIIHYPPELIHFNHFIAISARLPLTAARLKIPSLIMLHDFWPICHRVNLIDWQGRICPGPQNGGECSICVVGGPMQQKISRRVSWFMRLGKIVTSPHLRSRVRRLIPGGEKRSAILESSDKIFQERQRLFIRSICVANRLLVPSNFVRAQFAANGYPVERIEVVPLGIQIARRHEVPSPRKKTVTFAIIGSIIPIKGVNILINAFRKTDNQDIRLRVYGRQDIFPQSYVEGLKQAAKDDPRIKFMGPFKPEQREKIYGSLDVLVIPSVVPESFSLVAREALQFGKPVLASQIGALPEIITNKVNGFLVKPGSELDLENTLRMIANDPAILRKLDCPGPASILTVDEHLGIMENIYGEVLKKQPGLRSNK